MKVRKEIIQKLHQYNEKAGVKSNVQGVYINKPPFGDKSEGFSN